MEENLQGMPVLCVMAQADRQPKLNAARNAFEGAGVLMPVSYTHLDVYKRQQLS